jgi:uncharacterized membrane protein
MAETASLDRSGRETTFVLHPHRSLSPRGFLILMSLIGAVSFIVGMAFLLIGAWPVLGFFGLDVLLIYWAFRLNYRDGKAYEMVRISPDVLQFVRVDPAGRRESVDLNPYWARVQLTTDRPDGRTSLRLAAQGRSVLLGCFLTDDERRDLADALAGALLAARGGVRI